MRFITILSFARRTVTQELSSIMENLILKTVCEYEGNNTNKFKVSMLK